MNAYSVKVVTKLGSSYEKTIFAEEESAAIEKAKAKFPLHKNVFIEGSRVAEKGEYEREEQPKRSRPSLLQQDPVKSRLKAYEDGKQKMIRSAVIVLLGVVGTIVAWVMGYIVYLTLLAVGYGLIDFYIGYRNFKDNDPKRDEFPQFDPKR